MMNSIALAALALMVSGAAMAQSGGSSGSTSGGGQGAAGAPGTVERSKAAPGSTRRLGAPSGRPQPSLPSGPTAADEARRGSAAVDLHRNSATGLSPQTPSGSGIPSSSGATNRSPSLPLGPGTGAPDTKVPDSSVYNPGVQR